MTSMAIAALFWLSLHLIVAGPLRAPIVGKISENAFKGVFSLLSVAGLVGYIFAYRNAPYVYLWRAPPAVGLLAFALVFLGFLFIALGAGTANPTDTHATKLIDNKLPLRGISRVTRHPRLCGLTLWATAHLLVNGQLAATLLFGPLLVTVVNGMASIDHKQRQKLGAVWDEFEAQTSRLPFAAILAGRTRFELREFHLWQVVLKVAIFAGVFWLHGVIGPSPLFILQQ